MILTSESPLCSVIIPARNEEKTLPRSVAAIRSSAELAGARVEIVVVVNRCSDNTEKIAQELGCTVVHAEEKNLAMIRNRGARACTGEILITVDADSLVSSNMFTIILEKLSSTSCIGGGVLILPDRWSLGILATGLLILPLVLWYQVSCGLFFVRRQDFFAIGGFNEEMSSVEDIDFARRLKAYGKRSGRYYANLFRACIVTSARKFDHFGDWYFVRHPRMLIELLKGKNQRYSDMVWYDWESKK